MSLGVMQNIQHKIKVRDQMYIVTVDEPIEHLQCIHQVATNCSFLFLSYRNFMGIFSLVVMSATCLYRTKSTIFLLIIFLYLT